MKIIVKKAHEYADQHWREDGYPFFEEYHQVFSNNYQQKFAELIVRECIGILETEIELVKGYKSTACNDFDVRWHEGKIEHFAKLVEKNKKHFGVEE
jgi:hypothetical protein